MAPESVSDASAFLTCAQMSGLALSLGIATSVFLNGATDRIARVLPDLSREEIMNSINGADIERLHLSDDSVLRIQKIIASTIGDVFYLNVAGAALGLILAFLMRHEKLHLGS
ncbi:hypothetical protein ONZ43_g3883 [Nemania bipapillata]|uniref:Uncharacterized protein n=1 Tax=Nemania bipapillata TaxID=110536 RepID=A0ACC2IUU1_9PEZI|nr:hypothetical protein ONZ43_g3883 [Nemania bipapillata]